MAVLPMDACYRSYHHPYHPQRLKMQMQIQLFQVTAGEQDLVQAVMYQRGSCSNWHRVEFCDSVVGSSPRSSLSPSPGEGERGAKAKEQAQGVAAYQLKAL